MFAFDTELFHDIALSPTSKTRNCSAAHEYSCIHESKLINRVTY